MNSQQLPPDTMMTLTVHKRQSNAAVGGLMALFSYGLLFVWGIYCAYMPNRWTFTSSRAVLFNASLAFFVGIIIGSVIGYVMVRRFRKIFIYASVDVAVIVSGALTIPSWDSIVAPTVARYIGGISVGVAAVTVLVHTPEIATKNMRGAVVSVVSLMITTSMLMGTIFLASIVTTPDFDWMNELTGGMMVLYGSMGLLFLKCFNLESPIFLIENNQERDAFNTLKRLRLETQDTYETHRDFQEMKDLINDEKVNEPGRSNERWSVTFTKMLVLRLFYTISTSFLMLRIQMAFTENITRGFGYGLLFMGRFITEMITMYFIEKTGRRKTLLISSELCGVCLLLSAAILYAGTDVYPVLTAVGAIAIVYQSCIGLGLSPVSVVYASELFALKRKAASITAILIIENILQIALAVIGEYMLIRVEPFFLIMGPLHLISGIYFYKTLPETKGLSLRECIQLAW